MKNDWMFTAGSYVCDVRTVGVLIQDGKILVQRDRTGNEYALPGGHIQVGEALQDGLIREFKEETGADIVCKKMLFTEECFWTWKERSMHNLSFYYQVELQDPDSIPDTGSFHAHRDNQNVLIGWLPVSQLQNIIIYPEFIKAEIDRLDEPTKHFVTRA